MMPIRPFSLLLIAVLALGLVLPAATLAQGPFAPRVHVNDRVVTNFEVEQRALFLRLFSTPGDLEAVALDRLIEEQLQLFEARRLGITVGEQQIRAGMEEFAQRTELPLEEFIAAIGQAGVEEDSFREFVRAGLAWRQVLTRRYGGRIDFTDAQIDQALSLPAQRGAVRVLLSEIVLPTLPQFAEQTAALIPEIARIQGIEAFAAAARAYSASDSSERGGRLDWLELSNLPEGVRPILLQLRPGQVTPPVRTANAVIFLQLRAIERVSGFTPAQTQVEYAQVLVPGAGTPAAATEIARLRARADTCRDLGGLTPQSTPDRFSVASSLLSEVPTEIALELAKLDAGEISTNLRRGDAAVVLMLCARVPAEDLRPGRDQMRDILGNRRIEQLSNALLAELRAAARIHFP